MNFKSASDISHKRELWKQTSELFNGIFENLYVKGITADIYRLSIPYKNHEIKISESETRPLKFEIELKSLFYYQLTMGWEDSFEKFLNRFRKSEIEIGQKEFDSHYLIQSNDKEKTIKFFSSEIVKSFLKNNIYSLAIGTNKNRKANLISVSGKNIEEKESMFNLIHLHFKIIDKLLELMIIE